MDAAVGAWVASAQTLQTGSLSLSLESLTCTFCQDDFICSFTSSYYICSGLLTLAADAAATAVQCRALRLYLEDEALLRERETLPTRDRQQQERQGAREWRIGM